MKDCKACGAVNSESSEICYKCGEELCDSGDGFCSGFDDIEEHFVELPDDDFDEDDLGIYRDEDDFDEDDIEYVDEDDDPDYVEEDFGDDPEEEIIEEYPDEEYVEEFEEFEIDLSESDTFELPF